MTVGISAARVVQLVVMVAAVLSLVGCDGGGSQLPTMAVVFKGPDGSERGRFSLEIADSEPLRQRGLMFRNELSSHGGMIFIFENAAPRVFWMKNTKIPLDMIFVSSERVVQGVLASVPPMNQEPRSIPGIESKYVIELASGVAGSKGIRTGDVVHW